MTRRERLEIFFQRLLALPKLSSHDEALAALVQVLTEVEDEYASTPLNPTEAAPAETQGRMYPPHPNYEKDSDRPNMRLYVQKGHLTYIGCEGQILIVDRTSGAVVFTKD